MSLKKKRKAENCCVCNRKLFGRRDAVYCNYSCKNEYRKREKLLLVNLKEENRLFQRTVIVFEGLLRKNYKKLCIRKELLSKFGAYLDLDLETKIINEKSYQILEDFAFRELNKNKVEILRLSNTFSGSLSSIFYRRWQLELQYEKSEFDEVKTWRGIDVFYEKELYDFEMIYRIDALLTSFTDVFKSEKRHRSYFIE